MKKAIIWILIVLLLLGGGATVYYLFSIGAIGFELPEATDPAKCDLIALYAEPTEPVTEPAPTEPEPTEPAPTEPAPAGTYYVAGVAALCGSEWNAADAANKLEWNGETGLFAGVPCIIGRDGVEEIIEFDLPDKEKQEFHECCSSIRHNMTLNDTVIHFP